MAQLIDSSVFIAWERRGERLDGLIIATSGEPIALASITAAELLFGVQRADTPERRRRREVFVEAILSALPILPFDLHVARTHADIWARLTAKGQPIGTHDLLIAATALTHAYDVLTENRRDFARVPGLVVREPTW